MMAITIAKQYFRGQHNQSGKNREKHAAIDIKVCLRRSSWVGTENAEAISFTICLSYQSLIICLRSQYHIITLTPKGIKLDCTVSTLQLKKRMRNTPAWWIQGDGKRGAALPNNGWGNEHKQMKYKLIEKHAVIQEKDILQEIQIAPLNMLQGVSQALPYPDHNHSRRKITVSWKARIIHEYLTCFTEGLSWFNSRVNLMPADNSTKKFNVWRNKHPIILSVNFVHDLG